MSISESYFGSSYSVNLGFWELSLEPGQQALLYCSSSNPFWHQKRVLQKTNFSQGEGEAGGFRGRFEMIQAHYIYCVLYFYYYYISTTSDHQAWDTRDWQPQLYCTLECFKSPSGLLATVITPWNKWHCFHGYDLLGSFQPPFVALCLSLPVIVKETKNTVCCIMLVADFSAYMSWTESYLFVKSMC